MYMQYRFLQQPLENCLQKWETGKKDHKGKSGLFWVNICQKTLQNWPLMCFSQSCPTELHLLCGAKSREPCFLLATFDLK